MHSIRIPGGLVTYGHARQVGTWLHVECKAFRPGHLVGRRYGQRARVASHPGDARAKLQKLFDITSSPEGLAVELAVRDWSRRDGDVAGRLRRADNRRMTFVRSQFGEFCADEDDVEVRSMMSYPRAHAADALDGVAHDMTSTRLDRTQSGGSVWRDAHTLDSRRIRTGLLRLRAGLAGAVGGGLAARQDGDCPGGRAGADAAGKPGSSGARNGVHGQADQAQSRGGSGARRQPHLR